MAHSSKMISLIFCSEIPHDELIIAVYSFCLDLLLLSRKFAKTVQDDDHYKMADISAPSNNTKNFAPKKCKSRFAFFNWYVSVGAIGKLFKLKTRIFRTILNSRRVFKNY